MVRCSTILLLITEATEFNLVDARLLQGPGHAAQAGREEIGL
jgi:hypothetical protein